MKRKFKQLWPTIPPISTKRTIISHLNLLSIKKITTYDVGHRHRHKNVAFIFTFFLLSRVYHVKTEELLLLFQIVC